MIKYLWVFLISMVPIVELRGAIPVGVGMGLDIVPVYVVSIIGNMLPVPFIYLFARKVLIWGSDKKYIGKWFSWMLGKGELAGKKIQGKRGVGVYLGLLLFVGIPLPGTGAWTGTLAASILDLDFKKSSIATMGGVLLAGVIMGLVSAGVFGAIDMF
jgi:Predicted membrane protein